VIVCTVCDGKGRINSGGQYGLVRCEQCEGAGVLIDPQLERLIEATEKVATVLRDIHYIMNQRGLSGGI